VFCKQCSTHNSSCPSCKTTFKNSSVVFSIDPEILAALHGLESILKAKPVRELTPAKVAQRKSTSNIPPTGFQPSDLPTPSPAVRILQTQNNNLKLIAFIFLCRNLMSQLRLQGRADGVHSAVPCPT
jgi:hypothetical protein